MGLKDNAILWNKGENETSEIGPDSVEEGSVSHEACKFNNGWRVDAVGEGVKFASLNIVNSGAVEFWARLRGMNIVNGGGDVNFCRWFMWHTGLAAGNTFQYEQFFVGNGVWNWAVAGVNNVLNYSNVDFDVADGELAYFLKVWDAAGIDGGPNTRRYYVNKILMEASNVPLIPMPAGIDDFELGNESWGAFRRYPARATFDNVKIYQNITEAIIQQILNNSENEGFPPEYIIPNRFNRVQGLINQGMPL